MKFANRRVAVPRNGDNIEMSGEFFHIAHVERFYIEVDLFDANHGAIPAPLAVGGVHPAAQAGSIQVPEIVPRELNMLCHVLPTPLPARVAVNSLNNGGGVINEVIDHSFDLFFWQPQGQPRWQQPDGNGTGWIDHEIAQKEDPNETWGIWCMANDIPSFSVRNKAQIRPLQANNLTLAAAWVGLEGWNFRIEPIAKPAIYTPIPYVRSTIAEFSDSPKLHDM